MRSTVVLSYFLSFAFALPGGGGQSNGDHGGHQPDMNGKPATSDCTTTTTQVPIVTPQPVHSEPMTRSENCTTSTSTTSTTIVVCPTTCRLDFHGTFLQYPTVIEYAPVYAQTVNQYITEFSDGSPGQSSEETITAPPAPTQPPLVWTAFGVELTFPTTYVAYTSIDYATNVLVITQQTCAATSAVLQFDTYSPSMIAPSSLIQPGEIPPATIIKYVDSLPTVQAQLGGHVCDPANGGIAPFVPTATVTSATTIDGNTRIVHTTTVSVSTTSTTSTTPKPVVTTSAPSPPPPATQTVNAATDPSPFNGQAGLVLALVGLILAF